ncbi:MAG: SgcJ/EcaC family oxidoreductase [Gemmatimonadales bacterium]|jgi:uncharacterized protein (TIGR02246 family)
MSEAEKTAIAAVNKTFMECFAEGDAAGIAALYTDDGQVAPPNADVLTGKDAVQGFWQMVIDLGLKNATLTTAELDVLGDTAIEQGFFQLGDGAGNVADRGKFLVVWKQQDGTWKLHRDIWNSSRPPQ